MRPFGLGYHTIFLLWTTIAAANGFNLELGTESTRFMTSPVLQALGSNRAGFRIPELDPGVPPSFYGYQMKLIEATDSVTQSRLMIGAPKMTDPSNPRIQTAPTKPQKGEEAKFIPRGSVNACLVQQMFFDRKGLPPSCTAATPTPTETGDGFGTSIAASLNAKMSACATTRILDCSVDKYYTSFCYKSKNYGARWRMDNVSTNAACPSGTVDVLFVLDGSGSIGDNFKTVKEWVLNIVSKLQKQMESSYIQVGVVQYSHYYDDRPWREQIYMKTEIQLEKYTKFDEFRVALNKITLHNFTTHTGRVLEKVVSDFTNSSRFQKKNNNQMMLLMTDGNSNDPNLVGPNAAKLRDMGVTTFAVGVGNVTIKELKKIATGTNLEERVYSLDNFDQLDSLVGQLQATILNFVLEGGSSVDQVSYKMEFAQTGFSSVFERKIVRGL